MKDKHTDIHLSCKSDMLCCSKMVKAHKDPKGPQTPRLLACSSQGLMRVAKCAAHPCQSFLVCPVRVFTIHENLTV
jgi:hypothetical protein